MENLNTLLTYISELKEIENRDKDKYNVFDSIGFKTQEVMHSKFIAHLLNPKASHGAKNLYLNLFLKIAKIPDFNSDNVTVKTEKQAGKRRIDIAVENHSSTIIIENKIWAQDQDKQLEDYYCRFKEEGKLVTVVYLTPYGNLPSDCSVGENIKKEEVICISYEKKIIPWIKECAKLSKGRLKTSLEMYIEMGEILINRDGYMNEIFEHLKKDKKKLELAIKINSALQGRDFIKEFPETIDFLISRIYITLDDANPYTEKNEYILNLVDDEHELENWRIYYGDGSLVYATDDRGNQINLFYQNDLSTNNKWLQSLLFEDSETTDQLLIELFDEIRKIKGILK